MRSPLFHFLLAGAILFAIEAAWSWTPEVPIVKVNQSAIDELISTYQQQMGRRPTPEEARQIEERVIDEAIWLEEAYALALHQVDPVIQQRLLLNMRFLEGETDATEADLILRAVELGMDRSDSVVQRRLIERVKAILRAGVRAEPPSDDTLRSFYEANAERWREPTLLDLSHVYFSRDRRGARTESDAQALLETLHRESIGLDAAIQSGDSFLAGHRLSGASPSRIEARLGPGFARAVENVEVERWIGPVESAFGTHLVWVHERTPSRIPELPEIRSRVFEHWIEQASKEAMSAHLARRRALVEIRIVDDRRRGASPQARLDRPSN